MTPGGQPPRCFCRVPVRSDSSAFACCAHVALQACAARLLFLPEPTYPKSHSVLQPSAQESTRVSSISRRSTGVGLWKMLSERLLVPTSTTYGKTTCSGLYSLNLTMNLLSALGQAVCGRAADAGPARCPHTALPHRTSSQYLRVPAVCQDGHRGALWATQLPQLLREPWAPMGLDEAPNKPACGQAWGGLSHGGMWWSGHFLL